MTNELRTGFPSITTRPICLLAFLTASPAA
nr:MAG TPA: hypothetical protein [Bacteriophage sp.]